MCKKKGQISMEYIIIIAFVLFVILSILGVALFYSSEIQDSLRLHQVERFAVKIISAAETVGFEGSPARTTRSVYLPSGVESIQILNTSLVFNVFTTQGANIISYESKVELQGAISPNEGVKVIHIEAQESNVLLEERYE